MRLIEDLHPHIRKGQCKPAACNEEHKQMQAVRAGISAFTWCAGDSNRKLGLRQEVQKGQAEAGGGGWHALCLGRSATAICILLKADAGQLGNR